MHKYGCLHFYGNGSMTWLLKIAGAREWLASQGIREDFINYAIGNDRIPRKLQKWMAVQLHRRYEVEVAQYSEQRQFDINTNAGDQGMAVHISPEEFISNSKQDVIAISDWYKWVLRHQRVDISQLDWDSALEEVENWQQLMEEQQGEGHPSSYKYPKGWNGKDFEEMGNRYIMVEVPVEDLVNEGAIMHHCIGRDEQGYAEQVNNGQTKIFSLRDAKGWPHVTLEVSDKNYVNPEDQETIQEIWDQDESHHVYDEAGNLVDIDYEGIDEENNINRGKEDWAVEQIQGKQDKPPIDKYRPYVCQWLKNHPEYEHSEDQILSVSPESELLANIEQDRMSSDNFNKYFKHLSEDTMHQLEARIQEDGGKNWSPAAVNEMISGLQPPFDPHIPLLKSLLSEEFADTIRAFAADTLSVAMRTSSHNPVEREWVKDQLRHERYSPQVAAELLELLKDTSRYDAKKHKNVVYDFPKDAQEIVLDVSDRFADPGKFPMASQMHVDILGGLAQSVDPDTAVKLVERAYPKSITTSYEIRMHLGNLDPQHFYNIWARLPQNIQQKLEKDDLTSRGYSAPPIYSYDWLKPHEKALEQWKKYEAEQSRVENNNKQLQHNKLPDPELPQWQAKWHPEWQQASSNWLVKITQTTIPQ